MHGFVRFCEVGGWNFKKKDSYLVTSLGQSLQDVPGDETITHKCFFDISIGGDMVGRIVFGLYGNQVHTNRAITVLIFQFCQVALILARKARNSN
eukprot:4618548-Amphidinium_carterae.1